ncbi:PH domain leucine-rich repeat-containing protein phosphatase 2 [Leptonychotes weddellii]|uniref:PH domain leucine-rich repeat-containing protein phosphatase 2 n=1 Tax=Leptonychotes weddellii TaxID=9713 RepID=A0A7F8RK62_LEPWE|nr:PH domain leucine-rich repeat-containing protein phosphatase 2 [Leptonychotes weddellii]
MGEVEPGPAGPLEPPEPPEAPASRLPGGIRVLKRNMKRNGSRNCLNRRSRFGSRERDWLREDVRRGCVYLYGADSTSAAATAATSSDLHLVLCTVETPASEICAGEGRESLYLQLHGDLVRRLEPTERPLQIVYDYLSRLGFDDPVRIQEEATDPDLGCMLRFYGEKPCQMDHLDRILLSGIYNVRKGKTQLHKWAERLVVLCGTCLIVSSVKDCQTGKMHILPLVGGKVEGTGYVACDEEVNKSPLNECAYSSINQGAGTYHLTDLGMLMPTDIKLCSIVQLVGGQASTIVIYQPWASADSASSCKSDHRKMFIPTRPNSCRRSKGSFHTRDPPSGSGPGRHCTLGGCCHPSLAAARWGCPVLCGCFFCSKLNKLEQLEELNLSGNKLKTIPTTIGNCKRLHTLVAHSNNISIFPEILQLPQIQFVDLSCNDLTEILIPEALPATLQDLDLTGNTNLVLEHKTLDTFSHITTLKIDQKPLPTTDPTVTSSFWSHGLAEMAGQRNKLCVSALAVDNFAEGVGAVYGMFDGDRNEELPRLLQCTMADVLLEEVQQSTNDTVFMANTFLVSHRKLGMAGQKLGSSALLCYIRPDTADPASSFSLTVANVGTCQAVLCRSGKPVPLSKVFSLEQDPEEAQRVKAQKAIITEDNKVNGVTCCTRMLGSTYLYPWILPKPHISATPLTIQDELLILGNKALWEHLSYTEAVNAVRHVQDPLAAAKKLCTLAQSYGCQDNVGVMVVYLNIGEEGCTCEMNGLTLPGPVGFASTTVIKDPPKPTTPSSSSGIASEFSSEMSTSEVSSEVGSTASDEHNTVGLDAGLLPRPERRCSLHPTPTSGVFQRQPSCATFSSNQSDNGLDSDDDQPVEGVITNGSKVEVEVDIHCCRGRDLENSPTLIENSPTPCPEEHARGSFFGIRRQNSVNSGILLPMSKDRMELQKSPSTSCLYGKKLSNGSIVPLQDSLNLIEVATEAPKRKTGYFAAPTQLEPEDQFVVPRDLEEEVKEQMKQQQESRPEPEPNEEGRTELPEEFDTAL